MDKEPFEKDTPVSPWKTVEPTQEVSVDTTQSDTGKGTTTDTGLEPDPDPDPETEILDVYLLAGQSNMEGLGQVSALPPSLRVAQDDTWIYWSGVPEWRGLQPSSGYSSGWGDVFGPEVTFGRTMADANPTPKWP